MAPTPGPRTGPLSLVDSRRVHTGGSQPNRFGLLWLVFTTTVMALAVARHPSARVAAGAAMVYFGGVLANAAFIHLSAERDDGWWDMVRCLINGPIGFVAIVVTGGFASPAWMCAYPAVMGSSRESTRTSVLLTAFLVACHCAAYRLTGIATEDWPQAVGRGALLLTSSLFFRIILKVEEAHRSHAAENARIAERARASKQEAEARFRLAEQSATHSKMASLGLLAASVAHEINNPINTIINSAQIIIDGDAGIAGGEARFHRLIISEGERVARVVSNLLQFARGGGEEYSPTPLRRVIEKTLMLLQHQLDKDNIKVDLDIPRDLPPVRARMEELQQVYLNLLTNARYALLEKRKLHPDLRANIHVSARQEEDADGLQVISLVRDNGTGIAIESQQKIFDPFFSTKPKDEGTGLGLSVCSRIMREHRGHIDVASTPGSETTFRLTLPAIHAGALENTTGARWSAIVP